MKVISGREREGVTARSIEEFEHLSGKGDSRGWRFNRDAIHSRQETCRSEDMQDRREIEWGADC
jgi:hypothetical protein